MPRPDRRAVLIGSAASLLAQGLPSAARAAPAAGPEPGTALTYPFAVPPLPYGPEVVASAIDAETMMLHHDKHHAAYVGALNAALKDHPDLHGVALRDLLARIESLPEAIRATVRNNAGGHANHTMFWQVMGGRGEAPDGDLGAALVRDLGGFETFKANFDKAGAGVFGSGWAMVLSDKGGTLKLATRPNQDSPLMEGTDVLFGNDVWEHAYYLKYRNRRADYLAAWWSVLDWPRIGERYAAIRAGTLAV